MAESELRDSVHTLPLYIDVSAETDLSVVNSGTLLVSLGMRVWKAIKSKFDPPEELAEVYRTIKKSAYGYEKQVWDWDREDEPDPDDEAQFLRTIKVPGKFKQPFPAFHGDVIQLRMSVADLTDFLKEQGLELVAIFDGLDRLTKADKFWSVVEQDLQAIKLLEISVLAAGPLSIMY